MVYLLCAQTSWITNIVLRATMIIYVHNNITLHHPPSLTSLSPLAPSLPGWLAPSTIPSSPPAPSLTSSLPPSLRPSPCPLSLPPPSKPSIPASRPPCLPVCLPLTQCTLCVRACVRACDKLHWVLCGTEPMVYSCQQRLSGKRKKFYHMQRIALAAVLKTIKNPSPKSPWKSDMLPLSVALWVHQNISTNRHVEYEGSEIESITDKVVDFSFIT